MTPKIGQVTHTAGEFSVDASVRIEATDRTGLQRWLRYGVRRLFAMELHKQRGADLVYRCGKGAAEPLQSGRSPTDRTFLRLIFGGMLGLMWVNFLPFPKPKPSAPVWHKNPQLV